MLKRSVGSLRRFLLRGNYMNKRIKLLALASAVLIAMPSLADDLEDQLNAQQSAMLKMQNDFYAMQDELNSQNGQIEELRHEIEQLRAQINSLQQSSQAGQSTQGDDTSAGNDNKSVANDPSAGGADKKQQLAVTDSKGNALKKADDQAKKAYNDAYQLVVKNKLSESETAFKNYLENYPDNDLTPNAWYWFGQVQFKKGKLQDARVSFLNAAGFKNSPKRPDSLYKLGLIYKAQGDKDKAKRFFEVVVKNYPDDTSAQLAQKQLAM